MKVTDTKLKQLISLIDLLNIEEQQETFNGKKTFNGNYPQGEIRIVILQRGWVFIGRYYQYGQNCELKNAYCIRKWGTTGGLGQLAMHGKQEDTILDKVPIVHFHELTIVASICCEESKWKDLI